MVHTYHILPGALPPRRWYSVANELRFEQKSINIYNARYAIDDYSFFKSPLDITLITELNKPTNHYNRSNNRFRCLWEASTSGNLTSKQRTRLGNASVNSTCAQPINLTIAIILKFPFPSSSAAMTYCFPLSRCVKCSFPLCVPSCGCVLMSRVVIIAN